MPSQLQAYSAYFTCWSEGRSKIGSALSDPEALSDLEAGF